MKTITTLFIFFCASICIADPTPSPTITEQAHPGLSGGEMMEKFKALENNRLEGETYITDKTSKNEFLENLDRIEQTNDEFQASQMERENKIHNRKVKLALYYYAKQRIKNGDFSIAKIETWKKGWTFKTGFNFGVGGNTQSNSGVTVYSGGTPSSGSGNGVNGGESWSIAVEWSYSNVKTTQQVSLSALSAIVQDQYMADAVDAQGNTRKIFSPATQVIIMREVDIAKLIQGVNPTTN